MGIHQEIIIAGYGGQGVLFGGMLLAQAALEAGLATTWFPSYGAEMRGGTANSTVVISDREIGSPLSARPTVLIALNQASCDKFLPRTAEDALIIVNTSLVQPGAPGGRRRIVPVPATELAANTIGDVRTANVVAAGAFLQAAGILDLDHARAACHVVLADKKKLVPLNIKALELGAGTVR